MAQERQGERTTTLSQQPSPLIVRLLNQVGSCKGSQRPIDGKHGRC